jgi:hypothetical protein
MAERITRIREDLNDIQIFHNIETSPHRIARLRKFYEGELSGLSGSQFSSCDQQEKIDYLLPKNYLQRSLRQLDLSKKMAMRRYYHLHRLSLGFAKIGNR